MASGLATSLQWGYALTGQTIIAIEEGKTSSDVLTRKAGRRPPPTAMAINEGSALLGLSNRNVEVWDIETQKRTQILSNDGEESPVNALATFGKKVLGATTQVTLYEDTNATVYDGKHKRPVQTVAFIDEHTFSCGSEDLFVIWDIRMGGKQLRKLDANITTHHWFNEYMVTAGTDKVVRCWTTRQDSLPLEVERLRNGVQLSLEAHLSAFSPDLTQLLVQNKNGQFSFIKLD